MLLDLWVKRIYHVLTRTTVFKETFVPPMSRPVCIVKRIIVKIDYSKNVFSNFRFLITTRNVITTNSGGNVYSLDHLRPNDKRSEESRAAITIRCILPGRRHLYILGPLLLGVLRFWVRKNNDKKQIAFISRIFPLFFFSNFSRLFLYRVPRTTARGKY